MNGICKCGPAKDKGAINTCASVHDKFGSWCASSHATGQSPSTITGVLVVRVADAITMSKLLRGMGVGYGRVSLTLFMKDFKQDEIFQVCMVNNNTFLVCEVTM